jgi:Spy/CpxP family protein refolding chaperone
MSAVPGERVRIQAIIDGHAPKVLALRAAAAQARRHAFVTLAAPDFTQESFSRSLADVANADGALERENIAMMAQSLAVLTPPERQAMVTRTKARNHSWFWRMFRPRPARF